jgi:hypothetical protein
VPETDGGPYGASNSAVVLVDEGDRPYNDRPECVAELYSADCSAILTSPCHRHGNCAPKHARSIEMRASFYLDTLREPTRQ